MKKDILTYEESIIEIEMLSERLKEAEEELCMVRNQLADQLQLSKSAVVAEKALRESEKNLTLFIKHAPAALALFDTQMRYLAASKRWLTDNGIREDIIGRSYYEVFPEVSDKWKSIHSRCLAGAVETSEEDKLNKADGSVQWLRWEAHPWEITDGVIGGIIIFSEDITERKKNEAALWESNKNFELLSESANMLLVSDNPEKVINELCNKVLEHLECEAFFNYLVDEENGRLHLKAYSGISEEIAKDIEWLDYGVSVSGCVVLDAKPIVAEDIHSGSEPELELLKSFGFQACACNPLLKSDGTVIGTLTFASQSINSFSQDDLVLIEIITNQIAASIERTRLFNAAEEGQLILDALMEYVPEALVIADAPDVRIHMASKYAIELNGRPPESLQGITADKFTQNWGIYCTDGVTPADNEDSPLIRAIRNGEIVNNEEWIMRRPDGTDITILCNAGPIRDNDGEITGGVVAFRDVTGRRKDMAELAKSKAEAEERAAELQALLDAVPAGVWISHDPECKRVTGNRLAHKLTKYPPGVKAPKGAEENGKSGTYKMFRNGREMLPEERPVQMAAKGEKIRDFEFDFIYTDGSVRHMYGNASPIFDSEGKPRGAISVFVDWTDRAEFEKKQQELLEREHNISEMLQQALLPPQVPCNLQGISIATRYKPALKEAQVGGDFYDIFEIDNNKIGILIGDVTGKGLQAAIRVSAARHSIRSYAFLDPSPGSVMTLANEALIRENTDVENLLTAFFAVLDISNGVMAYANAGHEPPVVCSLDGTVKELEVTGSMLGIIQDTNYSECICNLNEGDKVVMFTDGITEARRDSYILFEKEGVINHLEKCCNDPLEDIADSLLDAATTHAGGILQDDVAMIVLGYLVNK